MSQSTAGLSAVARKAAITIQSSTPWAWRADQDDAVARKIPITIRTARGRKRTTRSSIRARIGAQTTPPTVPQELPSAGGYEAGTTSGAQGRPVASSTRAPEARFGVTVSLVAVTDTCA